MINFKKFINLHAEKKCPPGYKFDQKLGVCVPKGERSYYPYYGIGSRNGDTTPSPAPSDNGNGNGNGNGGNGNGGNGNGGNGGGE
tara:strand:- start:262 stop:516 length:255 start_codon:yes stop_codon:yes gene_type:complete